MGSSRIEDVLSGVGQPTGLFGGHASPQYQPAEMKSDVVRPIATPRRIAEATQAEVLRRFSDCGDDADVAGPVEAAIRSAAAPLVEALKEWEFDLMSDGAHSEKLARVRAVLAEWEKQ